MDRIELVGALGDDVALDGLFQPRPLKHGGLENRGRGVRIVFQQFCRASAVETQIEPAIEAGVVAVPALRDQRPEGFGDFQPAQIVLVVDRTADQFEAHRVDLAGRLLDLALDLVERKRVIGPFVPIALAIDGVEIESGAFGGGLPVVAFRTDDALHLAAAMRVAAMAGTMAVESMRRAAEAAIGRAAIGLSIRTGHRGDARAAVASWYEAHRHGADRGTSHQRQHDTTRAFHGCDPCPVTVEAAASFLRLRRRAQAKAVGVTASCGPCVSRRRNQRHVRTSQSRRA
jgi:hypothetical protein